MKNTQNISVTDVAEEDITGKTPKKTHEAEHMVDYTIILLLGLTSMVLTYGVSVFLLISSGITTYAELDDGVLNDLEIGFLFVEVAFGLLLFRLIAFLIACVTGRESPLYNHENKLSRYAKYYLFTDQISTDEYTGSHSKNWLSINDDGFIIGMIITKANLVSAIYYMKNERAVYCRFPYILHLPDNELVCVRPMISLSFARHLRRELKKRNNPNESVILLYHIPNKKSDQYSFLPVQNFLYITKAE